MAMEEMGRSSKIYMGDVEREKIFAEP